MTRKMSVPGRVSILALAVALAAGPTPAAAQSFQGTGTFTNPADGSISTPDAVTTNITINAPQAVIDWVPFDANPGPGAIGFQYDGTTATFSGASDFAVLNRIVPVDASRAIVMDGIINSLVGESTGGAIYFYSPGGIVIGSNAVINVGSLVLSNSPITVTDDGNGNFSFIDGNGTVEFGQAPNPTAQINIVAGSQISALNEGSYVAVVAPRVTHEGSISVNGAAALVGAEAATITFRTSGLFDIQVDVGTTDANGVGVNGTITGPASSGPGDYHRAYLVAVPKNTALTMTIGGGADLGFDIAQAADVVGNAVILSAGHDIFFGDTSSAPSAASGADADISIAITDFTSALYARANGDLVAGAVGGALNFASDVSFRGRDLALLEAGAGGTVSVFGDLAMSANAFGSVEGESATAGNVVLQAWGGGTVDVTGNTDLSAIGVGGFSETPGLASGDGTGGVIIVQATTGGDLSLEGSLNADATGSGGSNDVLGADGGDGFGGTVNVIASGGGTLSVTGGAYLTADGEGGVPVECISCGGIGGIGDAGNVNVQAHSGPGSSLSFGDVLYIWANGYGGIAQTGDGGAGLGGNVNFTASDPSSVTVAGEVSIEADGYGGYALGTGDNGGLGLGGVVQVSANDDGSLGLDANLTASADGFGGDSEAGDGGLGKGGTAGIHTYGTTASSIDLAGPAFVTANGQGGAGLNGGTGTGGIAYISAVLGTVHAFDDVLVSANSDGGFVTSESGTGGAGLADIETTLTPEMTEAALFASGGTIIVDGLTTVAANATGGDGGFNGGDGGDAVAAGVAGVVDGGAVIHAANSDAGPSVIQLGDVFVTAEAQGGQGSDGQGGTDGSDGGNGGSATGGKAVITAAAGSGDLTVGAAILSASAFGGDGGHGGNGDGGSGGSGGNGGSATGGFINVGTESGNPNFAQGANNGIANYSSIVALTTATGGDGGDAGFGSPAGIAGNGGEAFGGQSVLLVRGSEVNVGDVNLVASANGGDGGLDEFGVLQGNGGDAVTGFVGVVVTNRFQLPGQRGTLNAGAISGSAIATGGTGAVNGGEWTLGGSTFFQLINSDATFDSLNLIAQADGIDPDATETYSSYVQIVNGTVTVAGQFDIETPGSISIHADNGTLSALLFDITADNFVHDENRPLPVSPGTISASNIFLSTGQDLIVDANLVASNGVNFNAPGLIDFDNVSSTNGSIALTAGTALTAGDLAAANGDITAQSGGDMTLADVAAGGDVLLDSGASMSLGTVTAQTGSVQASAVDVLSFASITAGTFVTIDPTAIVGGDITALAGDVTATGDSIDIGNVTASDNVFLTALAGDLSTLDISAGIDVMLDATGAITTGDILAFGTVDASGGALDLGDVNASVLTFLSSIGDIATGDLVAFSSLTVDSAADFLFGSISAPLVDLNAPGSIIGGFIDSDGDITVVAGADIDVGDLSAGGFDGEVFLLGDIVLTAGGDILAGLVTAEGSVTASAGGGILTDAIDAADFVQLLAGTNIATGDILAGSYIDIFSSGGGIATGDLTGTEVDLEANGDISFADVDSDSLDFDATGAVTGGDIVAFNQVGGDADGAIVLGDITVGPGLPQVDDFSVGIASGTSIAVGNVVGTDRVGFATFGDLTTGDLSATDLVMTLVGGDIVSGSITTQSDGVVYMADASMFIDAGGADDNFDASLVLAIDPVPTGGSITINGPVSTGLFQAAAGNGLTTGAIGATTIEASAGGTATLNGIWSAQDVTVASNDIDITGSGGISGSASGLVTLISTNATQALIGDGLTGSGYALSNAEFGRIEGGSVYILARGDASAAQDMLIGDLTVTGPAAGSTIENSEGILVFATGDVETQTSGGVIRVVGDITATGFGPTNAMEFYADLFELDAATGSISITSSGATLAGELGLYADQIHVAEGSILDQLAIDPQYSGYQDDLNAPAAVQRPEGVLNAGVIWIESDNLQNVLIQNTGTEETPAGFRANQIFLNEDFDVAGPPGSIDVVVNGQLVTETGTLTGVAVRDALVAGADLTPFTANSTINSCLLAGPCIAVEPPEPPIPPGFTPTPGIQQEIVLVNDNQLPPPEFDNESFIDDNDETTDDGESSPIEPPQPLFDTSGLSDKSDVDDPVSGSGNPALMETPPPTSNQEKQQ